MNVCLLSGNKYQHMKISYAKFFTRLLAYIDSRGSNDNLLLFVCESDIQKKHLACLFNYDQLFYILTSIWY